MNQQSRQPKFHRTMKFAFHKNRHKPSHHLCLRHFHTYPHLPIYPFNYEIHTVKFTPFRVIYRERFVDDRGLKTK